MAKPDLMDFLDFEPDPNGQQPLYLQLSAALVAAILAGRIPVGGQLPSERAYAQMLGVSRTTVTAAYQELKVLGLLRGFVGRGAVVVASDPDQSSGGRIPWLVLGARLTRNANPSSPAQAADSVCLGDGWLHSSVLPTAALTASAVRVAGASGLLTEAPSPLGLPALRDALSEMLDADGVKTTSNEILITGGAQQGLNVVARALLEPGDVALCETPTWHGAFRAFRATGADVVGVPMDHEGIEPEALEDALARLRPKLVYLIPSAQCPTGTFMSMERRRQVVQLCVRYRTPILESHVYGDLVFGQALPSLKKLDTAGIVIQQGSASKTISPALRVGWLAAPRGAMSLLTAVKTTVDLATPAFGQAILVDLLRTGAYDRHLVKFRADLQARRNILIKSLAAHCPDLRFTVPPGGIYLWAQLPHHISGHELEAAAAIEGVSVRGGEAFQVDAGPSNHIRLCYAASTVNQIAVGAQRLGKALRTVVGRRVETAGFSMGIASV